MLKIIKPMSAVFFLPMLSETGPNTNCPIAMPKKTEVIIQWEFWGKKLKSFCK